MGGVAENGYEMHGEMGGVAENVHEMHEVSYRSIVYDE